MNLVITALLLTPFDEANFAAIEWAKEEWSVDLPASENGIYKFGGNEIVVSYIALPVLFQDAR